MKKTFFISTIAALTMGFTTVANAAAVNGGTINFVGKVVDAACVVSTDTANQTVDLGQVKVSAFGAKAGTKAQNLTPFELVLEQCDGKSATAAITFSGVQNATYNALTSTGTASGVGVYIMDNDGSVLSIGTASKPVALQAESNVLPFMADMISVSDAVTVGSVEATANFTITYA
ncbi:fimbrial protein [Enterobacteriaceae bacterium 4M9]|nr:fimbrial protein [Enterobacteriaceae bacterium 4M9]